MPPREQSTTSDAGSPAKRTKAPKPPAAPKPWRREDGRYRSADDRFAIEGGGAGRWFVTDEASLDELGLARTIGPFDTLDEAKAAAAAQREGGADASPLAERLAAARERPAPETPRPDRAKRAAAAPAPGSDGDAAGEHPGPSEEEPVAPPAARRPTGTKGRSRTSEAPARTWLDELAEHDAPGATRARRLIDALETMGVEDAEGVVRRDVLGRQPAIATRLLGRTLARALGDALDVAGIEAEASKAIPGAMRRLSGVDEEALGTYAAFVASRVLAATLGVVATRDRADDAGRDLPGWRLMERPAARDAEDGQARRLIVTPADVASGSAEG